MNYKYIEKIFDESKILKIVEKAKRSKKKVVFTNGCFDILHSGHIRYLRESRMLGDMLIIGLNSDESVRRIKGERRPINSQENRAYLLEALEFVDYIVIFNENTPERLVRKIKPDYYTKGGDYSTYDFSKYDFIKNYGGSVVVVGLKENSTTSIIQQCMMKN